jgi:hypothetical protein
VLVPATLAALPSTRAIPDRGVFYIADPSAPFPIARCSMSLVPFAPLYLGSARSARPSE